MQNSENGAFSENHNVPKMRVRFWNTAPVPAKIAPFIFRKLQRTKNRIPGLLFTRDATACHPRVAKALRWMRARPLYLPWKHYRPAYIACATRMLQIEAMIMLILPAARGNVPSPLLGCGGQKRARKD